MVQKPSLACRHQAWFPLSSCGTGINTAHLARRVGPGGSVTGVDPDSYRIHVAREEQACDNVNYVVAKSTCLPPREGGYDLVVSNAVMHWVNHEETVQIYEKASELLKKGGVLAVCEGAALMAEFAAFLPALTAEQRKAYRWHFLSLEENENIFKEVGGFEIFEMEMLLTGINSNPSMISSTGQLLLLVLQISTLRRFMKKIRVLLGRCQITMAIWQSNLIIWLLEKCSITFCYVKK